MEGGVLAGSVNGSAANSLVLGGISIQDLAGIGDWEVRGLGKREFVGCF